MTRANEGIQITGGSVKAGAMAAGKYAIASNVSSSTDQAHLLAELRKGLEELAREVHQRAEELDDPEKAKAAIKLAEDEAQKESPSKPFLLSLLETLGGAAGSVAAIGGSITAIVDTVSALTGG